MNIHTIPLEITEYILTFCSSRDLASFAQTCRATHLLIYGSSDHYLWRQVFLAAPFDDLRLSPTLVSGSNIDWKSELQDRIRAESVLRSCGVPTLDREISVPDAMDVVLRVIHHALPAGSTTSNNIDWAKRVLSSCPLFTDLLCDFLGPSKTQIHARLLSYMGLAGSHRLDPVITSGNLRTKSRCYVYDLRHYTKDTNFGVFLSAGAKDGRPIYKVNWVHLEYCINVIIMNLWELSPGQLLPPRGLEATRAYSAPGSSNLAPRDWAGVEGTWRRAMCFMDYRDLFHFNHTATRCNPAFFDNGDFHEATRLIELELRLVGPDDIPILVHPLPPADDQYPRLDIIGLSHSPSGQQCLIKGHVDKHLDGTIQWTFISIYDAQAKWLFNGIQLGNVCSSMGIAGTWTSPDHERIRLPLIYFNETGINTLTLDDPNGPSWIWKIGGRNEI